MPDKAYPHTPDGRYFVVRGRLWRCSNPGLDESVRVAAVRDLMRARSDMGRARRTADRVLHADARERVEIAKVALEDRGLVWWTDGAPD